MEDRAEYEVARNERPYIRAESLQAFAAWSPPTADELRGVMANIGLQPREVGEFVGVSRKEVNRWTLGQADIPYACWVMLCQRAGLGRGHWWL